jgi:cyclophilin family peptidyl-prolyl cis-trans isomerase
MKLLRLFTLFCGLFFAIGAHAANPMVEMKTNLGSFTLELYPDKAPKTVENFLKYVKTGFYKGTIFHRVIDNFMIQGGGFGTNLHEKDTFPSIQNEANNGLKNEIYTIAMARTMNPHSASAQFFINVKDNAFLDHTAPTPRGWGYAVFGKVVKGQDVAMKIAKVKTGPRDPLPSDVPLENVVIEDVKVLP